MPKTFEFPPHAALVNAAAQDYMMNLVGLQPLIQTAEINTGGDPREKVDPVTAFKLEIKCKLSDAVLALTPYFRIMAGPPSFPDGLATARFSLVVDNEIYILDGKLKNHLTDIEGNLPETAKLDWSKPKKGVFLANMISSHGTIPGSTFGYFLSTDSVAAIEIRGIAGGYGKVKIETGILAACYTSQMVEAKA